MTKRLGAFCVALFLVPLPAAVVAEVVAGEVLAASCFSCHGPRGVSPGTIPSIAGLDAEDLRNSLAAFRSGDADEDATVMTRIAKGFDEAELEAIVGYLTAGN